MLSVCIPHEGDSPTFSQKNLENQWSYVLENFRPDKIYLIGVPDPDECQWIHDSVFKITPYQFISDVSEIDEPLVFFHKTGSTDLRDFVHPTNACYVFGPNDSDMILSEPCVHISTTTDLNLYNWVAAAIVLYDRSAKVGN